MKELFRGVGLGFLSLFKDKALERDLHREASSCDSFCSLIFWRAWPWFADPSGAPEGKRLSMVGFEGFGSTFWTQWSVPVSLSSTFFLVGLSSSSLSLLGSLSKLHGWPAFEGVWLQFWVAFFDWYWYRPFNERNTSLSLFPEEGAGLGPSKSILKGVEEVVVAGLMIIRSLNSWPYFAIPLGAKACKFGWLIQVCYWSRSNYEKYHSFTSPLLGC